MKANRPFRTAWLLSLATIPLLAASCSGPRVVPPPREPEARPTPAPPPRPRPGVDWRDAPITPGDWTWSNEGGQSVARFAGGAIELRCDRANDVVLLRLARGSAPVTVTTSSVTRTLPATTETSGITVRMGRNDPLLDAIALSRGRFAIDAGNAGTLYVPSWPEISRVVEDCR